MNHYTTPDQRWQAVESRDSNASGHFVYAVRTTGVYCHPGCKSRMAKRSNVEFYDTPVAAEAAGYRACKRCISKASTSRHSQLVTRACRLIETCDPAPSLDQLSAQLAVSSFHLHRLFKAETGVTPKAYATAFRARRVRAHLEDGERSVTDAIYDAGYNSNSRFYESAGQRLGMRPGNSVLGVPGQRSISPSVSVHWARSWWPKARRVFARFCWATIPRPCCKTCRTSSPKPV